MDFLTGTGLAASAGLNAYIPLLALGLLDRHTGLVNLGPGFNWLSNGWVLIILTVLLALELVADKIPAVDTINDMVQTLVRPTSGGIVFGSSAASQFAGVTIGGTETVTDPAGFVESGSWVPIVLGIVIALVFHLIKSLTRPVVNTVSAGVGAPVVSTAEDITAILLTVAAILLPALVLVLLLVAGVVIWRFTATLRRRKARAHTA